MTNPFDPDSHQHYEEVEPLGMVVTENFNDMIRELAKIQGSLTLQDAIESGDFLGGMGYMIKTIRRLAEHVEESLDDLGVTSHSPDHGCLVGALLLAWAHEVDLLLEGHEVHMPDSVHVISWTGAESNGQ
jgi:hypothetical protein